MAINSGKLAAELVDGGLSPTAAKAIANAIANAASPQFSQGGDTADVTPTESLRLITADDRRYSLTNLDFSPTEPFNDRIAALKGIYANDDADHPYKDAQPRVTAPPLSAPAVRGSDYIAVDTGSEQNATVHTVKLKLQKQSGQHLRINSSTSSLDSVALRAVSQTPKYLAASVREADDGTEVVLQVRGLETVNAFLGDGTVQPVLAWTAGDAGTTGLNAPAIQRAIGSPAAWVNFDGNTNSTITGCAYTRSGTTVTVTLANHGHLVNHWVLITATTGAITDVNVAYLITSVSQNSFTFTHGSSGTTTGTLTITRRVIRSSSNVHSVSGISGGQSAVNFAVALQDADYCVAGTAKFDTGASNIHTPNFGLVRAPQFTESVRISTFYYAGSSVVTAFDCEVVNVVVFR